VGVEGVRRAIEVSTKEEAHGNVIMNSYNMAKALDRCFDVLDIQRKDAGKEALDIIKLSMARWPDEHSCYQRSSTKVLALSRPLASMFADPMMQCSLGSFT
jgi:hypothetical protein